MPVAQGWNVSDFRLPIGRHNGSRSALFWAKLKPGDVHHKHRHDRCEMVYYVIRGQGRVGAGADRAEIRGGHSHCIPQGVEHFMVNTSRTEPLEVIGVYVGVGSIDEAGYVFTGQVTPADLAVPTA
jgi:mannose-6-phosphate isomerase-like protein (cupin superfamily)